MNQLEAENINRQIGLVNLTKAQELDEAAILLYNKDQFTLDALISAFGEWHAPSIPTFPKAVQIKNAANVVVTECKFGQKRVNENQAFTTTCLIRVTGSTLVHAGSSKHHTFAKEIAYGLAVRNAIQTVCQNALAKDNNQ